MFKTVSDGDSTKIVTALQMRRIAQEELNASIAKQAAILETDKIALMNYEKACYTGTVTTEEFNMIMANASTAAKEYAVATKGAAGSTEAYVAKQQAAINSQMASARQMEVATGKTKALTIATKGLSIAMSMIAFAIVIEGFRLIGKAIDNYVNRTEYAVKAMNEAQDAITSSQNKLRQLSSTINDNKDRFLELSKGVDNFSKNVSLSEEDYAEYLAISNDLAEIFPALVTGYDEQGNALIRLGDNAEETSKKLNSILESEQAIAEQTLIDNMDSVAKGIAAQVESANDIIRNTQSQLDNYKTYEAIKDVDKLIKDVNENTKMISFGTNWGFSSEDEEKLKKMIKDSGARVLDNTELGFDSIEFFAGDYNLVKKAIEDFYSQIDYVNRNESNAYIAGLKKDIQDQEKTIREAYTQMNTNLSAWVKSTYEYDYLSEAQQDFINSLIPNLDWNEISKESGLKFVNAQSYEDYIRSNIIDPLMRVPDEYQGEVNRKFAQLLQFEVDDVNIVDFAKELENYLKGLGVEIDLTPIIGNTEEIKKQYEEINKEAAKKFIEKTDKNYGRLDEERKVLDDFAKKNSINTQDEIAFWNQCLEESKTKEEAMQKYLDGASDLSESSTPFSKEEMISAINEMSEGFEELDKIFESISDKDPFDFKLLDDKAFKDTFQNVEGYADFIETITSTPDDINACKSAFNELVGAWIEDQKILDKVDESTAGLTASMLKMMGVENAEEIVKKRLIANEEELAISKIYLAKESKNLEDATEDERLAFIAEQIEAGNCGQALALLELKKQLVNGTLLDTNSDVENVLALAKAAGISVDALSKLSVAKANFDNAVKTGDGRLIGSAAIELQHAKDDIEKAISDFESPSVNYVGGNNSNSGSGSKDTAESINWIDRAVKNLETDISRLDKVINSTFTSFEEKNEAIARQIGLVNKEIELQQKAYETYMAKADSIKLDDKYKNLVQNGALNIEDIKDEKLQKSIKSYQDYYDQAKDVQDKIDDLYERSSQLHVDNYNLEANQLSEYRDKHLIDMAKYYQSMMDLQDKYYNSEALKLKELADKMEIEYGRMGNVNLKNRPQVDAESMQAAGWTEFDGDYGTVYSQTYSSEDNNKQIVVTPILPDGSILSPAQLEEYVDKILSGEDIDVNIELGMFEGEDSFEKAENFAIGLHEIQEEYYSLKNTLSESPYGDFTEEQLKAIEQLSEELDKVMSQLSGELGDIKSAYDDLIEIRDTYNEYGKISVDQYQSLCDMGFQYLALLSNESGALSLDEEAFQRLANAKIQEMQVTMALQAVDLINNIHTEADAIQYLAASYNNLANQALNAAEAMLYAAQAKMSAEYGANSLQAQAANTIVKGYENSKLLAGVVDIKMQSGGGYKKEEEKEKEKEPEIKDWAEKLLDRIAKNLEKSNAVVEKISDKTDRLIDTVDKYITWQKKNSMINRAIKSSDEEVAKNQKQLQDYIKAINQVKSVINLYSEKLGSIKLPDEYKSRIQNGTLDIEEIRDQSLQKTIKEYEEYYNKLESSKDQIDEYAKSIEDCRKEISDLFDKQRDLIRQKLDNVLDYYSDMDSYLSSITAKVESLISLNDQMGKRTSLTELVEEFANLNKQIDSVTAKGETVEVVKKKIDSGTAESVKKAVSDDNAKEADRIQKEIDNLDVTQSGTYQKLLTNIKNTKDKIAQYEEKGWDVKKVKQYEKLQKQLENYYSQQEALDNDATSNTVANYSKVYLAWQKLMNNTSYQKLLAKESDGTLKANEQKRLDKYNKQLADYEAQMEKIKNEGQSAIAELENQKAIIEGTAEKATEAQKIDKQIKDIENNLKDTAIYKNLEKNIEDTKNKIAALDEIGYDNLKRNQQKTYDKLTATLESYYAQKEALDKGATASNIAEYNKIYLAWKKMQDKLDAGKNLSNAEWQRYDSYTKQLENWVNDKASQYEELNSQLQDALNPPDKQGVIKKEYEESSKQMYDSYQNQIDTINDEVKNTQNYKNLLANMRKLEQKKDTKGLTKAEEDKLKKYQAELEALEKGGTATNVADYMKTWEAWYRLQQKLDNGKKLSASEATKYDEYRAKLEAWNNEKQTQIDDLLSQMEDDLEKLNKTYTENISEAESEVNDYYAKVYELAKQIAEYNITALEDQLNVIKAMVSYYENLVGLYENFSGDKLSKLLVDLDEDTALSKLEIYQKQLSYLNDEYDITKNKIKEYQQLLDALDTNDFEASMELFNKVLNDDSVSQATKDNLQQVIDLLNERAVNADNWGEYADLWENEWQQALSETKQSLIEVAGSIQEINDAIRETSLEPITDAITQLGYLKNTLSSIVGLINDDWIFGDDGELTEYGNAKVSLLVEQMQKARDEADKYAQQMDTIMSMQDTYSSDKAYQEALEEAKANYLSSLNELKGFEDSVVSIMTQSNEKITESLKDVISARIKALKAQKDLYDYNKTITNSQKEIDSIKAQIDAIENLTGAMDAATKAKLAQLKADLEEKETALNETKDDHTYNLQIDALEEFMNTLDETMKDAADAVNKSFAAYKEAIDSALKVYEKNKDYLDEWSNNIIRNVVGFVNTDGTNTTIDVQQSGQSESGNNIPSVNVVNSDTVSAIESTSEKTQQTLSEIRQAIKDGLCVKVENPLTILDPNLAEVKNLMNNYLPSIDSNVATTIPNAIREQQPPVTVTVHYDNLLNVEGNIDKDFAKVLPKHLEEAYKYTAQKIYRELNILR